MLTFGELTRWTGVTIFELDMHLIALFATTILLVLTVFLTSIFIGSGIKMAIFDGHLVHGNILPIVYRLCTESLLSYYCVRSFCHRGTAIQTGCY
jgi:hypothetical protein